MDDLDEIVGEFLVESRENLDQLDQDLVQLERDPSSRKLLSSVFRTLHTIKGTSGFLAFHTLESVTHHGESLLSRLRADDLTLTPGLTTVLLEMVDAVRELLSRIEETGVEGDETYAELVARLEVALDGGEVSATTAASEVVVEAPVAGPLSPSALASEDPAEAYRRSVADTIRVDVALLDSLMNLVGELVLTCNQMLRRASTREDLELQLATHRLNSIAGELQEGVMKTRMQPIDNIWSKTPRLVRDLSLLLGKSVDLRMEGRSTELDKTILEALRDPLTHLIRNSVDHGIELPEVRRAAGKPETGTLLLRAFHEGGQVTVEVSDDGAGIDPDRLREKAVSVGLVSPEDAALMSDRHANDLIFSAGFSTAQAVTKVSGRGVGMDVVKMNIEKIGGTIDLASVPGKGTTVRIRFPLTLALIPALVVWAGGRRYALPQANLLELVRLGGDRGRSSVEAVQGAPGYRLRGRLLPLVDLREQLGLPTAERTTTHIAVLQADNRRFGLVVDGFKDTEWIVVKPLGKHLHGMDLYAAGTIMGDGTVSLILDTTALANEAGRAAGAADPVESDAVEVGLEGRQPLFLIAAADSCETAVPTSAVDPLDDRELDRIERTGGRQVV